ncbi:unnamed protein product [Discosporangium mesarthrocarpum]
MASSQTIPVHVEVSLLPSCVVGDEAIREAVQLLLRELGTYVYRDGPLDFSSSDLLSQCADTVTVVDTDDYTNSAGVSFWQGDLHAHIYRLCEDGPEVEMIDGTGEEEVPACDQWLLPSAKLQGLWESLVLERGIKNHLLEYATTAMLFTDKGVSKNVISWNRVVLLHGPPGTGKTSLCKALAHKLSIRLGERFSNGQLLEINAHSLFSKWFSESGKLVHRLFTYILELADDEESLVCVLIDEVESLTAARSAALGGNEPSDALRVVNAVLTQIDNLRERDNVLILTTSNVSEAIDMAFVDRADIKQYIGLPPASARYEVLRSCLEELVRVGIIAPPQYLPPTLSKAVELVGGSGGHKASRTSIATGGESCAAGGVEGMIRMKPDHTNTHRATQQETEGVGRDEGVKCEGGPCKGGDGERISRIQDDMDLGAAAERTQRVGAQELVGDLVQIAGLTEGLSGRALRKLPFQAHAFFVQRQVCNLQRFLWALDQAAHRELGSRLDLNTCEQGS